ncbi:MAG: Smr/MutS family protein [Reyranellaceae bacterium]
MSRKRPLPEGDGAQLFAAALQDAKPLKGRRRTPVPAIEKPTPLAPPPLAPRAPARRAAAAPALSALAPETGAHPDRSTAEKLRRGRMAVEASLDLHGMTLARAEPALSAFLAQAQGRGLRLVLVVTGKGARVDRQSGRIAEGAIRREFPHWLNSEKNRHRIVAFRAAHVRHGGGGAFYVLLKRIRR